MCEGEDRVRALVARLETCGVPPERIVRLASFKSLLESRQPLQSPQPSHKRRCSKIKHIFYTAHESTIYKWVFAVVAQFASCCTKRRVVSAFVVVVAACLGLVLHYELHTLHGFARFWLHWENIDLHSEPCTLEMAAAIQDTFRPPVHCSMCANVSAVDRVTRISPKDFERKYAYSGRPVVVEDGQRDWSAPEVFSFSFFKGIYANDSPVLSNMERGCQFFPYKTSFNNLREVFNMSHSRAKMQEGNPWYIGWSNCDSGAANVIREHYNRPYFLPDIAEESKTDWIFMGTPGHGAHMHIDHVGDPSWQAQIRGRKRWVLKPPPECFFECVPVEVTVNPGEIFVLDTNIWYHATHILPQELSITIGSEYD